MRTIEARKKVARKITVLKTSIIFLLTLIAIPVMLQLFNNAIITSIRGNALYESFQTTISQKVNVASINKAVILAWIAISILIALAYYASALENCMYDLEENESRNLAKAVFSNTKCIEVEPIISSIKGRKAKNLMMVAEELCKIYAKIEDGKICIYAKNRVTNESWFIEEIDPKCFGHFYKVKQNPSTYSKIKAP